MQGVEPRDLDAFELFRGLPKTVVQELATQAERRSFQAGGVLIEQGQASDALWLLETGRFNVVLIRSGGGELPLRTLDAGTCVGEMGLIEGALRSATVRAAGEGRALRLPAEAVQDVRARHPELTRALGRIIVQRIPKLRVALGGAFSELPEDILEELAARMAMRRARGGEIVIREGDAGDAMFIVHRGRFQIVQERGSGSRLLGEIGPGEVVGESALLTGAPRNATVQAVRDSQLLHLSRPAFEEVMERHPSLALPIARTLAKRAGERKMDRRAAQFATVAVLPLAPMPGLQRFCDRLAEAIGAMSVMPDAASVPVLAGTQRPRASEWDGALGTAWFASMEDVHERLLYLADPTPTPWTQACVRNTDIVLRVAPGGSDPGLTELERELRSAHSTFSERASELVLLHGDATTAGTGAWLDARDDITRHHHVRGEGPADIANLARFLKSEAVGLVIGGGGARGYAAAGIVEVLTKRGIPIDFVGGTSAGAMVAAAVAMGVPPQEIPAVGNSIFVQTRVAKQYTIPFVSLLTTRAMDRRLQEAGEGLEVEDLPINYFSITANLTRSTKEVVRRGPMWQAVRSSLAIPGVFPPRLSNGEVLVDGGVVDNLPVATMRALCPGPVIAIDVSNPSPLQASRELQQPPDGLELLMRRLNPFREMPQVPRIGSILMQALMLASQDHAREARELADHLLWPDTKAFGMLEFHRSDELFDLGRSHAAEVFDELGLDALIPPARDAETRC